MQARKLLLQTLGKIALFSLTTSVYAVQPIPGAWYFEGSVGGDQVFSRDAPFVRYENESSAAGNANLGYRFFPFFGVEIGGTYFGVSNITADNNIIFANPKERLATVKTFSYGVAIRLMVPIGCTGLQVFGKIGAQQLTAVTRIAKIAVPRVEITPVEVDRQRELRRDFVGNGVGTPVVSTQDGTDSRTLVPVVVNGNGNGNHINNGNGTTVLVDSNGNFIPVVDNGNGVNDDEIITTDDHTIIQPSDETVVFDRADNPRAAQLGIRHMRDTKVGPWFGLGAQYFFIPPLAGVVEWQRLEGNKKTGSFNLWSAGVMFIIY